MSMDSLIVYLSRIFLEFFLRSVYPTMVTKKFQFIFTHATKQDSPSGTYHKYRGRKKLPISTKQHFVKVYLPQQKGKKDYGAERITKINLGRILVTN